MRDIDQGHGRAAGDHADAAGAAEGERRGAGPGDDHQGRRAAGGQDHRLREVQVSPIDQSKVLARRCYCYCCCSGFGVVLGFGCEEKTQSEWCVRVLLAGVVLI